MPARRPEDVGCRDGGHVRVSQSSAPRFPSPVQCYTPGQRTWESARKSHRSTFLNCRPPHKFVPTTTHVLLVCTPTSTCCSPCTLALFWSECRRADPTQCNTLSSHIDGFDGKTLSGVRRSQWCWQSLYRQSACSSRRARRHCRPGDDSRPTCELCFVIALEPR